MVLVVDDSPVVREVIRDVLESCGYQVWLDDDAESALRTLRARRDIACVVSDLEMPGLGGLELLRQMRADQSLKTVPVVMVSGHRDPALMRRSVLRIGASCYLAKPVHAAELERAVREAIAPEAETEGAQASSTEA